MARPLARQPQPHGRGHGARHRRDRCDRAPTRSPVSSWSDVRVLSSWWHLARTSPPDWPPTNAPDRAATGSVWTLGHGHRSIRSARWSGRGRCSHRTHRGVTITAYVEPMHVLSDLAAARDDRPVFDFGDGATAPHRSNDSSTARTRVGSRPRTRTGGADFTIDGPLGAERRRSVAHSTSGRGGSWDDRGVGDAGRVCSHDPPGPAPLSSSTARRRRLAATVATSRADLSALTMTVDDRPVFGAGQPVLPRPVRPRLVDRRDAGARRHPRPTRRHPGRARSTPGHDHRRADHGAQPGRILHELRVGRAGVFGVPPGTPYFGAVDTAALFVIALGEASAGARRVMRSPTSHRRRAPRGVVRPIRRRRRRRIHRVGAPRLGASRTWVGRTATTASSTATARSSSARVALAEVQAYWYRALRTMVEIEQCLGIGDGAAYRAAADLARPASRSPSCFHRLTARSSASRSIRTSGCSTCGHPTPATCSGAESSTPGRRCGGRRAARRARPVLGLGASHPEPRSAAYNPFGYHRGSVWPHDTGFALHGAAPLRRVVRRW